jgi:hypothetical protein
MYPQAAAITDNWQATIVMLLLGAILRGVVAGAAVAGYLQAGDVLLAPVHGLLVGHGARARLERGEQLGDFGLEAGQAA